MGGNFGYELDLSAQMPEDLAEIRRQVALVKQLRTTTRAGTFTRLLSPFEGETTAWQFADDARVILCVYRRLAQANAALQRVFPRGLDPAARYRLSGGETRTGADWMAAGVLPELPAGDFASCVMVLEKG